MRKCPLIGGGPGSESPRSGGLQALIPAQLLTLIPESAVMQFKVMVEIITNLATSNCLC